MIGIDQSLAPALASIMIVLGSADGENYSAIFIAGTVFALLGAVATVPVRRSR